MWTALNKPHWYIKCHGPLILNIMYRQKKKYRTIIESATSDVLPF